MAREAELARAEAMKEVANPDDPAPNQDIEEEEEEGSPVRPKEAETMADKANPEGDQPDDTATNQEGEEVEEERNPAPSEAETMADGRSGQS